MLGRWICGAALLVWLTCVLGLRAASGGVSASRVMLDGGVPALLLLPPEPAAQPRPVAILLHDFGGNAGELGFLARQLARSGWAALAPDLQGHGRNPARFAHDGANRALARDVDAALEWVIGRSGELDSSRVALIGHGMGALAALQQAQWNPSALSAVVALAPPRDVVGPYPPPNALLLWGNWDRAGVRDAGRAIGARLAGRSQLVGERTYGDPERGGAVRIAELTGLGHYGLLWSEASARRVFDWLRPIAPTVTAAARERTRTWALLGWLAVLVLVWELPRVLGGLWLPQPNARAGRPALRAAGFCAALLAAALASAALPAGFLPLPLAGAREPLGWLALAGVGALLLAPRAAQAASLRRGGTWLGGAALAGALYLLCGPLLGPWLDPWPAPQRLWPCLFASAAALPFFAALECCLRVPGLAGALLPALARVLTIALLAGAGLAGLVDTPVLLAARVLALGAPLLELLAQRCARCAPEPWTSAIAQSLLVGWSFGALFPLDA